MSTEIEEFVSNIFVTLNVAKDNLQELYQDVGRELAKKGMVVSDYGEQLQHREADFPTGLVTKYGNVAIPHTDAKYVKESFVYAIRLTDEVVTKRMDQPETEITVNLFFVLGFTKSEDQLVLLTKMMQALNNESISNQFQQVDSPEQFKEVLKEQL
ncbi:MULTISPECIES: PTS sugar transporter subunit IIA [Enterococcus]|uniref:PTS sugar transporter subunit IIA n=1 Tax=Candidatus Enterococcus murrayae TaxID=2815321 RepID=A0ABS3HI37_9ENTE|nr:PTS sugar transporter subunit IIA [Enterococcus sp. MJM16]MBO0452579.1 PTS sugar transporter subunit IIA [Enterococcus sp. MJM16]